MNMKRFMLRMFMPLIALAAFCSLAVTAEAEGLPDEVEKTIYDSVFEIVIPKPDKDPIIYEKELPMHLIPFQIRNDKYYPIGTAFAIEKNRLVTAAHVMNLGAPSQWEGLFIRDRKGNIYEIDKIEKYSERQDYAVFTVKDLPSSSFLKVNRHPSSNSTVFSVGNAYGQGIVIRNGKYTSDTPEEINGEWNWIRFSAAASPGNSGGPLLDGNGNIIGIVSKKSESENLNYALPISQALDGDNSARIFKILQYKVENMDVTTIGTLDEKIPLPKKHLDLHNRITKILDRFGSELYDKLMKENAAIIFPNGEGSDFLLHNSIESSFPSIITQKEDKSWGAFSPSEPATRDLGDNGYITHGEMGFSHYMRIRKPDHIALKDFLNDSKLFMDLILKGIEYNRTIGSEQIRITSLGKADETQEYVDDYSRRWTIRVWNIAYADMKMASISLPVPGGCIAIIRLDDTANFSSHIIDMKALANFTYVSYYGTLSEWQELMKFKEKLPEQIRRLNFSYVNGKSFKFSSPRFNFSYGSDIMKITPDSDMQIDLAYFRENGKVIWDVSTVAMGEDKNNRTVFTVQRAIKPTKRMKDEAQSNWNDIVQRNWPNNGQVHFDNGRTMASIVHDTQVKPEKAGISYLVFYAEEGKVKDDVVSRKLAGIDSKLSIVESTAAPADSGGSGGSKFR